MKHSFIAVLLALALYLPSCKKYIQQQEENAIVASVTNGVWYVQEYLQNDSDITASFSGYLFKFNANNTVVGTQNGISVQGTWSVSISAQTITSIFPGAPLPLRNLNETWKITDSYTNFVVANSTDTVYSTTNLLQLQKQ
jgi:hypothetical protein